MIETCTGHRGRQFDHPTLGSWVSYALGSANKNLPTFVNIGRPSSPVQLTGGYLGATVAGTPFQPGATPIPDLHPPRGGSAAERERQMRALADLNEEFRERYAIQSEITARTRTYELAARMQLAAPEVVDFSGESAHILELYGIGEPATDDFGRQLLLARRLAERGVRFIQICQRGLLDSTLVVWTSEFGRSPWSQNTTGRDHNPRGYTAWLAGGGIKGGMVHGATDEVGYRAVEHPHYYSDLNATILHQLGLDHKKMEIPVLGRTMRLVEEGQGPIRQILS